MGRRSLPLSTLIRIIVFIILFIGSAIYWGAMNAKSYGSVRTTNTTTISFGQYKFCTIIRVSNTQFQRTCQSYNSNPPYITTSIALYGVWVTLDVILLLFTLVLIIVKPSRKNKDKLFIVDIVTAIVAILSFFFLWSHFIYFSSELQKNNRGLKLSSAFGAALSAFFILNIAYIAVIALPFVAQYFMADKQEVMNRLNIGPKGANNQAQPTAPQMYAANAQNVYSPAFYGEMQYPAMDPSATPNMIFASSEYPQVEPTVTVPTSVLTGEYAQNYGYF